MKQRQQDSNSLLLIPGQNNGEWQVIDTTLKGIRQGQSNLNGTVGVVALADVKQTRDGQVWRVEIRLPRQALEES